MHEALLAHYSERNIQAYFAVNQKIHRIILEAARNATLLHHFNQLAGRVSRARYRVTMTDEQWAKAVGEHAAMLVALKARNGQRLADILRGHIDTKFETVRAAVEGNG